MRNQVLKLKRYCNLHSLWIAMVILAVLVGLAGAAKIAKEKIFVPASASISFTYANASKGLNPDGTRLNPYRIISDDVIESAEKELGYSIDKSLVWVRPAASSGAASYTTDYTLYYEGKHRSQVLKAILDAWAQSFNDRYSTYAVSLDEAPENSDYIDYAQWALNEADKLSATAKNGVKTDNVWTDENGTSFKDLYDTAENLKNVDIANFKTYLIQNGITKDTGALKASISYKDKLLANKKALSDAQYQNREKAIQLYDPTLFPTISVPSISNSGKYYVTTTKTGLDDIYETAADFSAQSLAVQKMISEDQALLANIKEDSSKEECAEAEKMYQQIQDKLTELAKQINSLDKAYAEQKKKPFFRIQINGQEYTPEVKDANQ